MDQPSSAVAVVGSALRVPGAADRAAFWANQLAGRESVTRWSVDDLRAEGVPQRVLDDPSYVRARPVLDGIDRFAAAMFGFSPRDARLLDPQHRLFLEVAWAALDDAGIDPERDDDVIGVYASCGMPAYWMFNLASSLDTPVAESMDAVHLLTMNDKDYLATRVSYKLGLTGPSIGVQTACSSSLVAVHTATQALLAHECDVAVAGGVRINVRQQEGYLYAEGGGMSEAGRCRPFDDGADGSLFGSGVGVVVLRRLEDAADGEDTVRALVIGSAVTNDGAAKAGYTAPSARGQAEAIGEALGAADVDPATVGYVETHGTGTRLGDPIELSALRRAYRPQGDPTPCVLGAVKANIGHLDAAAGVVGLIKAVEAVRTGDLPPTINLDRPNREIDFGAFEVRDERSRWPSAPGRPRRAGVSSFGIGGTNAHVVLQEPPPPRPADRASRRVQILPLSARTDASLAAAADRLADRLATDDAPELADVAHTLQVGRRRLPVRRVVVAGDRAEAADALHRPPARARSAGPAPPLAFVLPGVGGVRPGLGRTVGATEPVYRATLARCVAAFAEQGVSGLDELLDADEGDDDARERLGVPSVALAATFSVTTALARTVLAWGLEPAAMLGHSIGEYVAASLADVLDERDAIRLVARRGELFDELPAGGMVVVRLAEDEVRTRMPDELSLSAVNAARSCVVGGPRAAVEAWGELLTADGVDAYTVPVRGAGHSRMLDGVVDDFVATVGEIELRPPRRPYLSDVTGDWARADHVTDPAYWGRHLRETVRFHDAAARLDGHALLELGPGARLAAQAAGALATGPPAICGALAHDPRETTDDRALAEAVGDLWVAGVEADWSRRRDGEHRTRVPLPTYPFDVEHGRYWVDPPHRARSTPPVDAAEPEPEAAPGATGEVDDGEIADVVATVWAEVLGLDDGVTDATFFQLGGDSLTATQVVGRLREAFDIPLSIRDLFADPTIAGLAAAVEAALVADIRTHDEVRTA